MDRIGELTGWKRLPRKGLVLRVGPVGDVSHANPSVPIRRQVSIAIVVVVLGGCATGPVVRSEVVPVDRGARECDSDWDGAFLGAAIGISPLVFSILTKGPGDDAPLGVKLGFVGGIAGFWIGLGIDSRNCVDPT